MSNEQMEEDVTNHIRDKLRRWTNDSVNLCLMADLDYGTTSATILTELLTMATTFIARAAPTMTPMEFGELCSRSLAITKEEARRKQDVAR